MQIKLLSEHVGAEISGVNLAADLPDDIFEEIDDAYNRYSVLVFRDQKLTPEQQIYSGWHPKAFHRIST